MSGDIVRWSADPDAPPGMHELLQAARADGPTPAELARLRTKVLAPKVGWLAAKWILVGLVVIGGGIAGYLVTRPEPRQIFVEAPMVARPGPVVATPAPAHAPVLVVTVPPAPVAPPVVITPPKPHRSPAPAVVTPVPPVLVPPAQVSEVSEVALLEQARAALRGGDLAHALELTDRAATLYSDGVLVEEREALEIEALAKLGRHDDAAARWSKFVTSYPHSNYRPRLQRLIEISR